MIKSYPVRVFTAGVLTTLVIGSMFMFLLSGEYPNYGPGSFTQVHVKCDTEVWLQRVGEDKPTLISRHAGVLTTIGKDWLEDQISDSPSTTPSAYISLSTSASAPTNAWTIIPTEIDTGGGLDRVGGTYASTGAGTWTVSKQFTADTTYTSVQLMGLNWSDTDSADNTLLFADTFTATTLASGDKLTVTASLSVS